VLLFTVGISHKTAPIEVREQLAFPQEHIPGALKALISDAALEEVALLSTCNRTEFYCSTPVTGENAMHRVLAWWQDYRSISFDVEPYLYSLANENAVKHVMRVASGLDSMIIGEPQILGQLKTAFTTAHETGVMGKRLSRLFQTSFSIAKKVRTSTGIANNPVSVAYAGVTLAKQIFTDLSQATVLLMGAGENSELTLQHLAAKNVKNIIIINRTLAHAQRLAANYGAQAQPFDSLAHCLTKADIVISAMSSPQHLLTPVHLEQALRKEKRRPILMIDLGVPRNIDPLVSKNEDVYLYTIDDLQGIILQNVQQRKKAAVDAEGLIMDASNAYMDWISAQRESVPHIRTLRDNAHTIKNELLNRALRQMEKGEDPRLVISQFAHQLTQKLMHEPTQQLRKPIKSEIPS
jgi:glutamyl-tRNA reductase